MLRLGFVALLYLFLLNLVGAVRRDLSRPTPTERPPQDQSGPAVTGRLIVLDAGSTDLPTGRSLPLEAETTIGRAPQSRIRLSGGFVSAQHAVLRWRDGRWYLEDLQSTNGTLLNRTAVRQIELLEFGDVIEIGDVKLKLAP